MQSRAIVGTTLTLVAAASGAWALQPERPRPAGERPAQQRETGQQGQPGEPGQRQPGERGPRRERGPGGPGGELSVEQAMKSMNRPLRQLRAQVGDASKKEENLRLINDMQRGCVLAKGQPVPQEVTDLAADDAARASMAEQYRRQLMASLRLMVDAEEDIMDGDAEGAATKLGEIAALRDESHRALGIEDE